jgi:tetratricopeptide (TPR) repeat protein
MNITKAKALHADQRSNEALEILDQVLKIDPSANEALVLKGNILLALGDYTSGWPLYENWHNNIDPETYKKDKASQWDGQPTDNLVILRDDQGFGDCIQFLRYVPMVQERCSKILMVVKPGLEQLVRNSFPGLQYSPYQITDRMIQIRCDPLDFPTLRQSPITSLGSVFNTTVDSIPNKVPYLFAPGHGIRGVGVCWNSGNQWENAHIKSIPYRLIRPLIDATAALSLQQEDLRVNSFAETAAIIKELDLVITVDTAVAHLAGALGKPVWILLAKDCSWRWMQNRTDSPWYPTAKLYRQKTAGDWQPVIDDVMKALDNLR